MMIKVLFICMGNICRSPTAHGVFRRMVADDDNFHLTREACPIEHWHKINYILDFATRSSIKQVPDPYYGQGNGFERVLDLIEDACEGLLLELEKELKA